MAATKAIAIKHADRLEFECPDCHTYMTVCDTTSNIFSHGEVSQEGGEYLYCPNCGKEFEFKDVIMPHDPTPTPEVPF